MRYFYSFFLVLLLAQPLFAGEKVAYTIDNNPYEGYLVKVGPQAPLILLIHDWDGMTGYEEKRSEMLGELGYNVFAADLFGAGVRPTETEDKKKLTGALYQDREQMRKRLNGALKAAADNGLPTDRVVAIGYCFGGAAVLELARSGADLRGFVAFHGGLATPEGQDYSKAKGRYLILHGGADAVVSMEDFGALANSLEKQGVDYEMITYGGAPHAFTVYDSKAYRENADKLSWARFVSWLKEIL